MSWPLSGLTPSSPHDRRTGICTLSVLSIGKAGMSSSEPVLVIVSDEEG